MLSSLVLQLALNQLVTATIIHVNVRDVENSNSSDREVHRAFFFLAPMRDSLAAELSSGVMFETVSRRQKTSDPVDLAADVVDQESRKAENEINQNCCRRTAKCVVVCSRAERWVQ